MKLCGFWYCFISMNCRHDNTMQTTKAYQISSMANSTPFKSRIVRNSSITQMLFSAQFWIGRYKCNFQNILHWISKKTKTKTDSFIYPTTCSTDRFLTKTKQDLVEQSQKQEMSHCCRIKRYCKWQRIVNYTVEMRYKGASTLDARPKGRQTAVKQVRGNVAQH